MPSWMSFTVPGTDIHVSTEFLSGMVLPGIVFALLFAWPFIDSYDEQRHFSMDPLARPWQTAVGVTGVVFVMIASIAGMNTIAADITGLSTNLLNPLLLGAMILGPLVAGGITYVMLDRYDADGPAGERGRPMTADGGSGTAGPAAGGETGPPDDGESGPPDETDSGPPDGDRDA